jgi:tetratricopeptide (TPR) repeat protein
VSKSKKHKPQGGHPLGMAHKLQNALARVDDLLQHHEQPEAFDELQELAQRYPGEPEVWIRLFNTAADLKDDRALLMAARRLVRLRPRDPDIVLGLAGAHMSNIFPALALQTLRDFLARWPDHPKAADARKTIAEMESRMQAEWEDILPPDRAEELAVLHEQAQVELNEGHYAETRRLAEQVLTVVPQFPAPLNNISLSYFLEGQLDEAVATARRVLEIAPDNFHALSNLVHYLCLLGQFDEARSLADRLKSVQSSRVDVWSKKAEALSFLGNDEGVLDVFRQAEQVGMLERSFADPFLIHLAATATARIGKASEARNLWGRALKVSPGFSIAQENLDDLNRPMGERSGPWALPLNSWLPRSYVEELERLLKPATRQKKGKAVEQAARQFLQRHPEMNSLVSVLMTRGDPEGRQFALHLARIAETPEMLAALEEFALGQAGPDKLRIEAAQTLAEAGRLPRGKPVKMWSNGKQTEMLLMACEITTGPQGRLPNPAQKLLEQAIYALRDGDPDKAEPLLRQALAQLPDHPSLLNNLAAVYSMRGDNEQAEAVTRQIVERNPDYLFGRCSMAQLATLKGNYDEADEWLEPVMGQPKLHITEFSAICQARVRLELARGRRDSAKSWLNFWAGVEPDHPDIEYWREKTEPFKRTNLLQRPYWPRIR